MTSSGGRAPTPGFYACAMELDRRELAANRHPGGPTIQMIDRVVAAESEISGCKPTTLADFRWLAARLARAIENEWRAEAVAPLIEAVRRR